MSLIEKKTEFDNRYDYIIHCPKMSETSAKQTKQIEELLPLRVFDSQLFSLLYSYGSI